VLDFTDRKEFRSGDRRKPSCLPNRVRNFDNELHSPTPPQIVPACPPAKGESKRRVFQGAGWHLDPCAAHFRFTSQVLTLLWKSVVRQGLSGAVFCERSRPVVFGTNRSSPRLWNCSAPGEALRGWRPGNSYVFRDVQQMTDKCRRSPETHPYFGMLFCAPDCHTFWRNAASDCESESNARKSAAEFERFSGFARCDWGQSGLHRGPCEQQFQEPFGVVAGARNSLKDAAPHRWRTPASNRKHLECGTTGLTRHADSLAVTIQRSDR